MPCDRKLKPRQTIKQRADEVRAVVARLDKKIANGSIKPVVGKNGAIAFPAVIDSERDGVTDACIYRRLLVSGSALTKAAFARAEQIAGRAVDKQIIGQGAHSHDGGRTWHDHK